MKSIICYIPNNSNTNDEINYICSDNRVHVRFRDFNEAAVVAGFEQKLTYLITYLMNYSYLQDVICTYDQDTLMAGFLKSKDVADINSCIRFETNNSNYKGLKLRKNYSKKDPETYKPFGRVSVDCFPLNMVDSMLHRGDLTSFLCALKISLRDYLFDDNYIIIIDDVSIEGINKKFINKMNRKEELVSRSNMDIAELW